MDLQESRRSRKSKRDRTTRREESNLRSSRREESNLRKSRRSSRADVEVSARPSARTFREGSDDGEIDASAGCTLILCTCFQDILTVLMYGFSIALLIGFMTNERLDVTYEALILPFNETAAVQDLIENRAEPWNLIDLVIPVGQYMGFVNTIVNPIVKGGQAALADQTTCVDPLVEYMAVDFTGSYNDTLNYDVTSLPLMNLIVGVLPGSGDLLELVDYTVLEDKIRVALANGTTTESITDQDIYVAKFQVYTLVVYAILWIGLVLALLNCGIKFVLNLPALVCGSFDCCFWAGCCVWNYICGAIHFVLLFAVLAFCHIYTTYDFSEFVAPDCANVDFLFITPDPYIGLPGFAVILVDLAGCVFCLDCLACCCCQHCIMCNCSCIFANKKTEEEEQ